MGKVRGLRRKFLGVLHYLRSFSFSFSLSALHAAAVARTHGGRVDWTGLGAAMPVALGEPPKS